MRKILVLTIASLTLALGAAEAQAVITEPIPADVGPAPPQPIPSMPTAGETPPAAEAIGDPITPEASCGGWYLQSNYGERWPATSSWWEYQCRYDYAEYYPHPCSGSICEQVCYGYPYDCYWVLETWVDFFYWDGSKAVFYGESYSYSIDDGAEYPVYSSAYWWDGPTAHWYQLGRYSLAVSKAGSGSGEVSSSPAGISCGGACQASFDAGTEVTLTATPDASSIFTGWSGDCSGTESCRVTMDQARSVTATFAPKPPPPNAAPTATFSFSCTGLSCSFNGSGSADSDGTIAAYSWDFGDGTSGSGGTPQHTYAQAGSYTVALTVTDDDGATATDSQTVTATAPTVISLSAHGYKVKGLQKVDLSWTWNGSNAASFDIYRNSNTTPIATVSGVTTHTDSLNSRGSASYTYEVCEVGTSTCSNEAKVSF
jgi:PKD repeat protein